MHDLQQLQELVERWGTERGIIGEHAKATKHTQFRKLIEEVEELRFGILKDDIQETLDGIGDCCVVLILLARLVGYDLNFCLNLAYKEISKRKGKMIDGFFVKDSD